jgi:hypothetical protein
LCPRPNSAVARSRQSIGSPGARVRIAADATEVGAGGAIDTATAAGVVIAMDAVLAAAAEGIETADDVVRSPHLR